MTAAATGGAPKCDTNCTFSEDSELTRAPLHKKRYWQLVTDPKCDGGRISRDPYGWIDGGFYPGASYQECCTSEMWKGTALPLIVWPEAAAAFGDPAFVAYVRRWVDVGAWAQPDPGGCTGECGDATPCGSGGKCVLSMDGYGETFGPDGKGGCLPDTDPSDGTGRFPARHGTNRDHGAYASKFGAAMWKAYANKRW
eukprot:gene8847-6485_t